MSDDYVGERICHRVRVCVMSIIHCIHLFMSSDSQHWLILGVSFDKSTANGRREMEIRSKQIVIALLNYLINWCVFVVHSATVWTLIYPCNIVAVHWIWYSVHGSDYDWKEKINYAWNGICWNQCEYYFEWMILALSCSWLLSQMEFGRSATRAFAATTDISAVHCVSLCERVCSGHAQNYDQLIWAKHSNLVHQCWPLFRTMTVHGANNHSHIITYEYCIS